MSEHQRYPLVMEHPNYWPGSIGTERTGAGGMKWYEGGLPARFPPVTVRNQDQEEEHAAKGYLPAGKSDPTAYSRAIARTDGVYEPVEFPKFITWNGQEILVETAEEERALLEDGIQPITLRSQIPPPPVVEKTAEQLEIEALKARVDQLMEMLQTRAAPAIEALAAQPVDEGHRPASPSQARAHQLFAAGEPMTRGQKAWATRQANKALAAQKVAQPSPEPASEETEHV